MIGLLEIEAFKKLIGLLKISAPALAELLKGLEEEKYLDGLGFIIQVIKFADDLHNNEGLVSSLRDIFTPELFKILEARNDK